MLSWSGLLLAGKSIRVSWSRSVPYHRWFTFIFISFNNIGRVRNSLTRRNLIFVINRCFVVYKKLYWHIYGYCISFFDVIWLGDSFSWCCSSEYSLFLPFYRSQHSPYSNRCFSPSILPWLHHVLVDLASSCGQPLRLPTALARCGATCQLLEGSATPLRKLPFKGTLVGGRRPDHDRGCQRARTCLWTPWWVC